MNIAPEPCPHCGKRVGLRGWWAHERACGGKVVMRMADDKTPEERTDEDQPEKPAEDEKDDAEKEAQAP